MARQATKAARPSNPATGMAEGKAPVSLPKRSNQSAKLADAKVPAKSDVITECKNNTSGAPHIMVSAPGHPTLGIPQNRMNAELNKLAKVGGSYAAVKAAYEKAKANPPVAKLANGLDGRSAPHSAKAVGDAAGKGNPAKGPAKSEPKPADKKAARKEAKAATAAPKADDKRSITIVKKDFAFGREGTARRASWDICLKAKTAADYIAKGGAAKYLPRWVAAGAIKLA